MQLGRVWLLLFCALNISWLAKFRCPNQRPRNRAARWLQSELHVGHVVLSKPKRGWDQNYYPAYGQ